MQDDVSERLGDEVRQGWNRVVDVRERNVDLGFAREGAATGRGLVGDDAEGVEVTGRCCDLAHGLFGRQVLGGAHDHAGGGQINLVSRAGNTKIGQLHHAVGPDEDVRGLDVAVHDTGPGCCAEGHRNLDEDGHQVFRFNARAAPQVVRQRVTVDKLHNDPADAVFLTRVLRVRNVRMRDRHRVAGFQAQAGERELLACKLRA